MIDSLNKIIGQRIKEIREFKDLTQKDLANRINDAASNISSIESGKRKNITLQTLIKIADALNIDLIELIRNNDLKNYPEEILELTKNHPEITQTFVDVFVYATQKGIEFQKSEDYYYLWKIMKGFNK